MLCAALARLVTSVPASAGSSTIITTNTGDSAHELKFCKYGDGSLLSLNWMQSSLFELNLIGGREDYFTNNWANTYTLHKWLPLCASHVFATTEETESLMDLPLNMDHHLLLVTAPRQPAARRNWVFLTPIPWSFFNIGPGPWQWYATKWIIYQ